MLYGTKNSDCREVVSLKLGWAVSSKWRNTDTALALSLSCDVPLPEHEGLAGGQDGGDDPGSGDHDPGSPLHVSRLESPQGPADDQISEEDY